MTEHERQLVHAFNNKLGDNGIAWRFKQSRFTSQLCDIAVDTKNNNLPNLAIEAKSQKADNIHNATLYFSSDFSQANNTHQVEHITEFINRSGRKGYLALEIKKGRGKQRQCYLIPWPYIKSSYNNPEKVKPGVSNITNKIKIPRNGNRYTIHDSVFNT